MAKKKELTPYERALDGIRAPVRWIDEAIQNWDRLGSEAGTLGLNKGTRIASGSILLTEEQATDMARAVLDHYGDRFKRAIVTTQRSAFNGNPLMTSFSFYESPGSWSGVMIRFDSDHQATFK